MEEEEGEIGGGIYLGGWIEEEGGERETETVSEADQRGRRN